MSGIQDYLWRSAHPRAPEGVRFRIVWPPEKKLVGEIEIDTLPDSGDGGKRPVLTVQDRGGSIWQYRAPASHTDRWSTQAVRVEIVGEQQGEGA